MDYDNKQWLIGCIHWNDCVSFYLSVHRSQQDNELSSLSNGESLELETSCAEIKVYKFCDWDFLREPSKFPQTLYRQILSTKQLRSTLWLTARYSQIRIKNTWFLDIMHSVQPPIFNKEKTYCAVLASRHQFVLLLWTKCKKNWSSRDVIHNLNNCSVNEGDSFC